jgi:L,D-transpeptidase-like protein
MATDYSSERGNPKYPQCGASKLALRFTGSALIMTGGTKSYTYPATSGRAGAYAPIPKGRYWIQPDQLWHCNTLRQVSLWLQNSDCNSSGWGMYRITIHQYPGTQTKGRGGFFLHGGNHIGSAGCINLGLGIDGFVRDLQSELNSNETCYIPLSVD